jgi:hypothetical protein
LEEYKADGCAQTTHFRFVNALAKAAEDLDLPPGHESSAHQFHVDLFLSGFERVVLVRAFSHLALVTR